MSKKDFKDEDVLAWIRSNPNFLVDHPEIINLITPPSSVKESENLVDFQKLLVKKLQKENADAIETQYMLVEHSRNTLNNLHKIHMSVLQLLDANSFEEFVHVITAELSITLDVDVVCVAVESAEHDLMPAGYMSGVRLLKIGDVEKIMKGRTTLLASATRGDEYLFGEAAGLVYSQCLLELSIHPKMPKGLLLFGSRDPEFFKEDQAVDQIEFLAQVIERSIRAWLSLP